MSSPTTPADAANAARLAIEYMQGLTYIFAGALILCIGPAAHYLQKPTSAWLLLVLPPLGAAYYFLQRRQRACGLWAEEHREPYLSALLRFRAPAGYPPQPLALRTALRVASLAVFASALLWVGQSLYTGEISQTLFHAMVACAALLFALMALVQVFSHDLREHLLSAAWFAGGILYTFAYREQLGVALPVVLGGGWLVYGLLLHWRWRDFIRAHPLRAAA